MDPNNTMSRPAYFRPPQGTQAQAAAPQSAGGFSSANRLEGWGTAAAGPQGQHVAPQNVRGFNSTNQLDGSGVTRAHNGVSHGHGNQRNTTPTSLESFEQPKAPAAASAFGAYRGDFVAGVAPGAHGSSFETPLAANVIQDRARSRERDRGRPIRIQDLVNEEDDERFLPMEEEDEGFRASRWRGYHGVNSLRENTFPEGPSSRTSLPPVSAMSANSYSFAGIPPSTAHVDGPGSNSGSYYSQQLQSLSSLALNDPQHASYGGASAPHHSLPQMGPNYFVAPAAVSAFQQQQQQQQHMYMYSAPTSVPETPPRSTNSMPAQSYGIRKSNNTPRLIGRAAERAALVSSLPSPRRKQPSDSLGSVELQAFSSAERPQSSSLSLSFEVNGPTSSGGSGRPSMRKCYIGAKASQFCHVCRRSNKAEFAACSNLKDGSCRKVVCDRCFSRYNWNWQDYVDSPTTWKCAHCLDQCPPKASCHLYSRINAGRGHKNDTKEKTPASSPAARGAGVGVAPKSVAPLPR